jgi:hypothetical protein
MKIASSEFAEAVILKTFELWLSANPKLKQALTGGAEELLKVMFVAGAAYGVMSQDGPKDIVEKLFEVSNRGLSKTGTLQ